MRTFTITDPNNGNNGFQVMISSNKKSEIKDENILIKTDTAFTILQCKNLDLNSKGSENYKTDYQEMFPPMGSIFKDVDGSEITLDIDWLIRFCESNSLTLEEVAIKKTTSNINEGNQFSAKLYNSETEERAEQLRPIEIEEEQEPRPPDPIPDPEEPEGGEEPGGEPEQEPESPGF